MQRWLGSSFSRSAASKSAEGRPSSEEDDPRQTVRRRPLRENGHRIASQSTTFVAAQAREAAAGAAQGAKSPSNRIAWSEWGRPSVPRMETLARSIASSVERKKTARALTPRIRKGPVHHRDSLISINQ